MTNNIKLNRQELETILRVLEETSADKVEIETFSCSGIGFTITAKIDDVDHDVTDYGRW